MDVEDQYKREKGPNTRHFGHFYLGAGIITDFDESKGTEINPWKSSQFLIGYRYKLKLLSFYALGLDLNYKVDQFALEGDNKNPADSLNPLTFSLQEKKHSLTNNSFGLELYQRINFTKRGNSLGKYFDTGIRMQWNFADVEEILTNFDDAAYVGRERIINRRLKYIEDFSYGLSARIGSNHFSIHSFYRLSDYFKKNDVFDIPELPRLTIGFQYAIY